MRKLDVIELFNRLCKTEFELLKYINRTQGELPAALNFYEAAESLCITKDDVRRAVKRLVECEVLLAGGGNFQINSKVYKA